MPAFVGLQIKIKNMLIWQFFSLSQQIYNRGFGSESYKKGGKFSVNHSKAANYLWQGAFYICKSWLNWADLVKPLFIMYASKRCGCYCVYSFALYFDLWWYRIYLSAKCRFLLSMKEWDSLCGCMGI